MDWFPWDNLLCWLKPHISWENTDGFRLVDFPSSTNPLVPTLTLPDAGFCNHRQFLNITYFRRFGNIGKYFQTSLGFNFEFSIGLWETNRTIFVKQWKTPPELQQMTILAREMSLFFMGYTMKKILQLWSASRVNSACPAVFEHARCRAASGFGDLRIGIQCADAVLFYMESKGICHETNRMIQQRPVNNVLLVKIEGPVWYTIYHHLPMVFKGFVKKPSIFINQPMGIWDIYEAA